jgi:hypothetical protein
MRHDKETGEDIVQTSFTEGIVNKNLSAMGFVKMDLLGLANLRVIAYAIQLITGCQFGLPGFWEFYEKLRAHNVDLDDQKVMKHIFWKGNFGAIFQFTNPGIRALAKRVKPDSFIDISAIVSLYRPGPLKGGYDRVYVQAKHGEVVTLGHKLLDEILGSTKGCLVFQEQLMEVCRRFGKMTGKEVNRVRKVLLKKDKSKTEEFLKKENDELYASFHKGCLEHDFPEESTLKLWEDIKAFGGYAFNKSWHYATRIPIYTQEGHFLEEKRGGDFQGGEYVRSRDEVTKKELYIPVVAKRDHGIIDLIEVTFDDGSSVKCTWDHKFRTTDGRMLPLWQIQKLGLDVVSSVVSAENRCGSTEVSRANITLTA